MRMKAGLLAMKLRPIFSMPYAEPAITSRRQAAASWARRFRRYAHIQRAMKARD